MKNKSTPAGVSYLLNLFEVKLVNKMKQFLKSLLYPKNNFGLDNYINRNEWLEKTLGAIPAGKKLLDAGAGELGNKKYCSHLNYVSQDICQYEGKGDGQGLHTSNWDTKHIDIVSDITDMPVEDASFDAILCSEVLEHVADPNAALKEFGRVLKPGGVLVMTAPFCSLTHFAPYHFSSGFNSYYYSHYLPKYGFEIQKLEATGNYFSYLAQELYRVPQMSQDFAGQKLGVFGRLILLAAIHILAKFSKTDKNSSQEIGRAHV